MVENNENLTPAMKQFHQFKAKYPDAILFFRMGDFYETFYEDAQVCSSVLGLDAHQPKQGRKSDPAGGGAVSRCRWLSQKNASGGLQGGRLRAG